MRHRKSFNHLSRKRGHRKAMLSNMAASLIIHKRIKTTTAKAKALRMFVEPLITKSKDDSTHSRRIAFSYLQNKDAVTELFREISPKIADRPGGYTRILKTGTRLGDNAEMCVIELVDYNENLLAAKTEAEAKTSRRRRRGGKKKALEAGEDIIESPAAAAGTLQETAQEAKTEEVAEETQPEAPAEDVAEEAQPEAETEETVDEKKASPSDEAGTLQETAQEAKTEEVAEEAQPEAPAEEVAEEAQPEAPADEVAEEKQPEAETEETADEKKESPANEAESEKKAEDNKGKETKDTGKEEH